MATHTPGPWIKSGGICLGAKCYGFAVTTEDGLTVANCRCSDNPRITERIGESNAWLVAAAPDMAQALASLVNQCEAINQDGLLSLDRMLSLGEAITAARNALTRGHGYA